jgi:hypothetical protein
MCLCRERAATPGDEAMEAQGGAAVAGGSEPAPVVGAPGAKVGGVCAQGVAAGGDASPK